MIVVASYKGNLGVWVEGKVADAANKVGICEKIV